MNVKYLQGVVISAMIALAAAIETSSDTTRLTRKLMFAGVLFAGGLALKFLSERGGKPDA
jgi:hypothetical protein